jgi:hypothetical protein
MQTPVILVKSIPLIVVEMPQAQAHGVHLMALNANNVKLQVNK